ncbi:MAG: glycosyltransferase [Cyclobacteriaceae bacterium]|nr:glycosyltransferase [Cyclobacteriaceae bacterium]
MHRICRWSWKVSVGNAFLADFARQYADQVIVLPTVVDTEVHTPPVSKQKQNNVVIGWTGSHSTLFYLDSLLPILRQLEKTIPFDFLVIANQNPKLPLRNFRFIKWNKETEIEDLASIDIGLMPLEDTEWAKGKCGFKLIQYGALAIPSVASPVGVNQTLISHATTGFLASTPSDWTNYLSALLDDPDLRHQIGQNARLEIIAKYSVSSLQENFLKLFEPNQSNS